MKMKIIDIHYYTRNRRKETRPDRCPKASKSPLIVEQQGRRSGGSHSASFPFKFIIDLAQ